VAVNKVKGFTDSNSGRVNTGVIFTGWATVYDQNEPTMWLSDADGGSRSNVHPYWKLAPYAFGNTTAEDVEDNEALNGGAIGSYDVEIFIQGKIKTAVLLVDDPYYAIDSIINSF
jgi:hypothetical protein